MKTNSAQKRFENPVLVAPDRASAGYVHRALKKSNVEVRAIIAKTRGCISEASKLIGDDRVVLVLIPSPKLGKEQFSLTRRVVEAGGHVFAWVSPAAKGPLLSRDDWYLANLLEQQGATPLSRLDCIVEGIRMVMFFGEKHPLPQVSVYVKTGSSSLQDRVASNLQSAGIRVLKRKPKKTGLSFSISADGEILLKAGNRRALAVDNLSSLTKSLAVLLEKSQSADALDEPVVTPEQGEIDLIVRPPARLLSETASKRVRKPRFTTNPCGHGDCNIAIRFNDNRSPVPCESRS